MRPFVQIDGAAVTVRRALAVLAWGLLVLLCSSGVWAVIRTAGTGVTSTREVPAPTASLPPPSASAVPSPSSRPHRPTHHSGSGTTATAPPTTPPPTPADGGRTPSPGVASSPQGPPADEVGRTWQGSAGAVVATCRRSSITFRGAQANSGWRVEVGNRGPEQVEVQFAGGDDSGREVHVTARCDSGAPRFSTSTSTSTSTGDD